MSNRKFSVEMHLRIYDDENGQYITVRPNADSTGCVELAVDPDQEAYWGKARIAVPPKMARLLGQALIKLADEIEPPK